jgi:glycosyltransferase involved in cell wall biosynthesis
VYYGIDTSEYPPNYGKRDDYMLYMGSLIAEKRVHWAGIVAEKTGLKLKIAGPKWQPEYWPILDEMEKNPLVEFVGDKGGEEKLELIRNAKCLIHPIGDLGWVEAGAIIVLEALACGTPVVGSMNGCMPEYIVNGHNGYLCGNPSEMADAITNLHNNDPHVNVQSVMKRFTYDIMARNYDALAMEVVGGERW